MTHTVDTLVVGAGFGGLRALHTFRSMGFSVAVVEAGEDVGGVWYFNQYPGARCDVESFDYSYRFSPELEQEWRWSERYATQPEILRYINHVVDRFDLRRDIVFNTRIASVEYDETTARWTATADDGRVWNAEKLILAVGQLSEPKRVTYPGQERFKGRIIYSAQWPKDEVTFEGKRVGIIGTGSSGVQMTPVIARQAEHLTVFQRTANYSIPASNAPVSDEEDAAVKARYAERRQQARNSPSGLAFAPDPRPAIEVPEEERKTLLEAAWNRAGFGFALTFKDILLNMTANDIASTFIKGKIAQAVEDPVTREKLTPKDLPFGTRRPSVDSGYFQAFNRPNVTLADISEAPIEAFTETGIRTTRADIPLDIVIYATGFDALTGSLLKPRIVGRGGVTLAEKWAAGPVSYLGLGVHGFPNMFIIVGPGSPSILANVILATEDQIDWLADLFEQSRTQGVHEIEATEEAERDWVQHVNDRADETLYPGTNSSYVGANIPGKPRVFLPYSGGIRGYRRILEKVAADGYKGFDLRQVETPVAA